MVAIYHLQVMVFFLVVTLVSKITTINQLEKPIQRQSGWSPKLTWKGDVGAKPQKTSSEGYAEGAKYSHPRNIQKVLSRKKRFLTFPPGSTLEVENELFIVKYKNFAKEIAICIALPYIIELPDGRLTVLGAGLDYSDEEDDEEGEEDDEGYENSYNRYNHFRLRKRSLDLQRKKAFDFIEAVLDSFGLPGRSCLLKAICEIAEEPIESLGLLGEMLTMLLSPGFGGEMEEMREFVDAEITGRLNSTCFDSFKDCPIHLVDFLHSGVSMLHSGLISAN